MDRLAGFPDGSERMNDGERKTLQQSMRDAWMGVLNGAEADATRAAQRLFELTGLRPEGAEPPASIKDAMHDLVEHVKHNRDLLERRVEDGVKAAVARVHAPLQEELATLRTRLEAVQRRVEALKDRNAKSGEGAGPKN